MSPDSRMVAIAIRYPGGSPYGELGVADLKIGKVRALTRDHELALSPVWTPDSRSIYFASSRGGTLNIWKIGDLPPRKISDESPERYTMRFPSDDQRGTTVPAMCSFRMTSVLYRSCSARRAVRSEVRLERSRSDRAV